MFRSILVPLLCYFQFAYGVTNLKNLGGTFGTTSLNNGRSGKCATSGFVCTFSELSCPYGAGSDNSDNLWVKTSGRPDQEIWSNSVGTSVVPDQPSAAVQITETNPFGVLMSDPITCQDGDGQVMFSFWGTKNTILQICAVSVNGDKDIQCSENYNQKSNFYPGPMSFKLSQPINQPFYIRFMISSPPEENFGVLDEISYFGSGCSSGTCDGSSGRPDETSSPTIQSTSTHLETTTEFVPPTHFSTKSTLSTSISTSKLMSTKPSTKTTAKSTTASTNSDLCRLLNCDFESDLCQYNNLPDATVPWQRRNSGFGSPFSRLTDIQSNGEYFLATAIKANNRDVSILQSPEFRSSSDKTLEFKFYRGTMGSTIKLCTETNSRKFVSVTGMKECPSIIPPLDKFNARTWNDATVDLNRDVTKFYLIALHEMQTSGDAAIAIDHISIRNCA